MDTTIELLAVVHHPVRRRIVEYLVLNGPAQVGTLARAFDEQVGSVSHHLRMLERVDIVERAPELAHDGRTSWWRYRDLSMSWSVDDFERPVDQHRARAAEKLNLEHQLRKLVAWKQREAGYDVAYRRAAYSTDSLAHATPEELTDLGHRLQALIQGWRSEIDLDDGQEREPVFLFSHGFPTQP